MLDLVDLVFFLGSLEIKTDEKLVEREEFVEYVCIPDNRDRYFKLEGMRMIWKDFRMKRDYSCHLGFVMYFLEYLGTKCQRNSTKIYPLRCKTDTNVQKGCARDDRYFLS